MGESASEVIGEIIGSSLGPVGVIIGKQVGRLVGGLFGSSDKKKRSYKKSSPRATRKTVSSKTRSLSLQSEVGINEPRSLSQAKQTINETGTAVPASPLLGIRCSIGKEVKTGQYRKGTITSIKKYGIFVELESGHSGLVHISELSWGRNVAENVRENGDADIVGFSIGDAVRVKVLSVSDEGIISLSIKQTLRHPFDLQKDEIKNLIGMQVVGVVDTIRDCGIFVRILPGVTGLIPRGEVKKFGDMKKGSAVKVYVDCVDWDKKHVTLLKEKRPAIKQVDKKPDATIVSKKGFICVDGSNIIGHKCGLRTRLLRALLDALSANGYRHKVFLDKSTFRWLTRINATSDLAYLRELESKEGLLVTPNKVEADGQILQFMEYEKDSHIISCDEFKDYVKLHPWLMERENGGRVHGFNVVPIDNGAYRMLPANFNLDIVVTARDENL